MGTNSNPRFSAQIPFNPCLDDGLLCCKYAVAMLHIHSSIVQYLGGSTLLPDGVPRALTAPKLHKVPYARPVFYRDKN